MEFSVQSNVKGFVSWLDDIQKRQVPYATSRALNDTAVAAQEAIQASIQTTFQNRKKWWLKQQPTGIKVKFSNKRNLRSRVFTDVYFANLQEKGGKKTSKSGRKLAVPTDKVPKKYRISHGAKLMLEERNKVFANRKGVFQRVGKKTVRRLFSFTPSAQVKPRFGFMKMAKATAKREFSKHFAFRLKQALASAKKPPSRTG